MTRLTRSHWITGIIVVLVLGGAGLFAFQFFSDRNREVPPSAKAPVDPPDIAEQVHAFCGACHAYPSPASFPQRHWRNEVERGYRFFEKSAMSLPVPPIDSVVRYYESRAPADLPSPEITPATRPLGIDFERVSYPGPKTNDRFAISNVNLVHLPEPGKPIPMRDGPQPLDILACDMRSGLVMLLRPYEEKPVWKVLANRADNKQAPANPAHAEVVDLDGDGILDVLVADLGSFPPTDLHCGRVVWLRGKPDGTFAPLTLLSDVGRVADVQAADFRRLGKGHFDLVVSVFGWQASEDERVGIFFLENQTTNWETPKFVERRIDARHGGIHVPVADLNGDGKPDIVALFAQEFESVVAFVNEGDGQFRKETLYSAPDPSYGSSGIQLVDRNGDKKVYDILLSNGDTLDEPHLFKPYHGVQWLENKGNLHFEHRQVTSMFGVHRAIAADLMGTGKKEIVAVSFLPQDKFPDRGKRNADALIVLEPSGDCKYARHSLATINCDHVTCAVGDVFGTGRLDIVVGNFISVSTEHPVTIWKNVGKSKSK